MKSKNCSRKTRGVKCQSFHFILNKNSSLLVILLKSNDRLWSFFFFTILRRTAQQVSFYNLDITLPPVRLN